MAASNTRKSLLLLTLAASLMIGLAALVIKVLQDDELREKLDTTYYVLGLSIIGTVLLVLSGYVWDQGVMHRLRTLRTTAGLPAEEDGEVSSSGEPDHDEIIGLARNIERMAQALQKTE